MNETSLVCDEKVRHSVISDLTGISKVVDLTSCDVAEVGRLETLERLSMTITTNGKRQGGPRDQFFLPFLTFAVCSLPFSTRREVVSPRWKMWVKSVLFWAVAEILTIVFVKARVILSFLDVKQLSFTDFIWKLWKKWNRKLRTVLYFFKALLITFNKSSNVCAAVLFPNFNC